MSLLNAVLRAAGKPAVDAAGPDKPQGVTGKTAGKRPHERSGGMRVALARALAATTNDTSGSGGLLLMDEPFAALDAITGLPASPRRS